MQNHSKYQKVIIFTLIFLLIYPLFATIIWPNSQTVYAEGIDTKKAYAGLALTSLLVYMIRGVREGELNLKININRDSGGQRRGDYSDEDIYWLARAVTGEARGEPYLGQVAVAAVILNRVEHLEFPETVYGVIYQKGQFAAVDDGQINLPPTDSAYSAARDAVNGDDPSQGAIFFYNPNTAKTLWWLETREKTVRIGDHVFAK